MKVISFIGGPSIGKSVYASKLFVELKTRNLKTEIITEIAKDLAYDQAYKKLANQFYVFGEQYYELCRVIDTVDYAITDSPIILSAIYDKSNNPYFEKAVIHEYNKFNNYLYYIERSTNYQDYGRIHNEEESIKIDNQIIKLLDNNGIKYKRVKLNDIDMIVNDILG